MHLCSAFPFGDQRRESKQTRSLHKKAYRRHVQEDGYRTSLFATQSQQLSWDCRFVALKAFFVKRSTCITILHLFLSHISCNNNKIVILHNWL